MMASGAIPRQRMGSAPQSGAGCYRLLPGGRWLLISTHIGSVLYYDLDALEVTANVLIPEQPFQCTTLISPDLDTTSPTLRFNLAFSKQNLDDSTSKEPLEVWQVDLVSDDTGRGVGLRAICLKSFYSEPPGYIHSLSLRGTNLAYSLNYSGRPMTVVVSWKSIDGPNYLKRIFSPSGAKCARLLPGDLLFSASKDGVCIPPLSSLPEATVIRSLSSIKKTAPTTIATLDHPTQHTVADSLSHEGTARLVMYSDSAIRGLAIEHDNPDRALNPNVKTFKIADVSEDFNGKISVSENFVLTWDEECGGLVLRQITWSDDQVVRNPFVCVDQSAPFSSPEYFTCILDMLSGRIVIQQSSSFVVLDFAFLDL
ncbi:hypothetical protein BDN72DRAFT_850049 [Pluteus cervinus]|uniref:Uncharacterized protein n=1 Tax=Pluteus cervinus TaxID=181527 RepID=A0ACD3A5Q6_9AGAR|nr:hypothetical protein BDN72DRAFT_850049 [Pluteus cervinus]